MKDGKHLDKMEIEIKKALVRKINFHKFSKKEIFAKIAINTL